MRSYTPTKGAAGENACIRGRLSAACPPGSARRQRLKALSGSAQLIRSSSLLLDRLLGSTPMRCLARSKETTDAMIERRLGASDLEITSIGVGAWVIGGGDDPYGWGPQNDNQSIATIHRALDLSLNWIDAAAGHGHGHSEEVVGRAVAGRRDDVVIATKGGILRKEDGSDIHQAKLRRRHPDDLVTSSPAFQGRRSSWSRGGGRPLIRRNP